MMLAPMITRVFLGWDGAFLPKVADWLLARRDTLPRMLVVVPTSQAGRRLREALAEQAGGALLSPKIATPGALMRTPDPAVAVDWMERLAWMETLETIEDWQGLQDLFPEAPETPGAWSGGLAAEFTALRRSLQENGLTLAAAARILAKSPESGRWDILARLESRMERTLDSWGLQSRSRVLAGGLHLPGGIDAIVLAGITEAPPLLEKALLAWHGPVSALIPALQTQEAGFSPLGKPLECWTQKLMPWPDGAWGTVYLVADPRQEAAEALRVVSQHGAPSNEIVLGCADRETGDELARVFTRAGWTAFHPATQPATTGLARWLKTWKAWLIDPTLAILADLLAMPETAKLIDGSRSVKAELLAGLRNEWMVIRSEDLRHRLETARSCANHNAAREVLRVADMMENHRAAFMKRGFEEAMRDLLERMAADESAVFIDWLDAAAPVMRRVRRDAAFWLSLMLEDIPAPSPLPPDERVIDVQGWLELLYEPGRHLVLCGMNEGKVPARQSADPFLGEAARAMLGLTCDADRAARDAFLYQAMLEARRDGGRIDVFCAKTGAGGTSLLPSRLLLAAGREELPERVAVLFCGVEPPEAGMRWHADWKWQPRAMELPQSLGVTSFSTWLACPFRFYLKHLLRMQDTGTGRIEWNARDFGSVAHEVLERWGGDHSARVLTDPAALHERLSALLDEVAGEWFGAQAPLAVRLQTESLRQRLLWFARQQAATRTEGWETIAVETKFDLRIGPMLIRGTYDRLDRHRETGALRVIDYKTGKIGNVEKAHRSKMLATTVLPAHLPQDSPVIHDAADGTAHRWNNLQLPLYAMALKESHGDIPTPCYFHLGPTEANVALEAWNGFCESDLEAASLCAEWITGQVAAGVFWPPAEKPSHDDYEALAAGRTLIEMCEPVPRP
jgi:ATP-dependent helicase/nuclease subunit B